MEKTIKLKYGYTDAKGEKHVDVTFGKRLTVRTMLLLDADPQAQNPTQYGLLIRRQMMTKFGTLKLPPPLQVLVKLDTFDSDLMSAAANEFLRETTPEADPDRKEDNRYLRLDFPWEVDGMSYDQVRFGKRLTVGDNVEADKRELTGIGRLCFQLGRQIAELRDSETGLTREGQLDVEHFHEMDSESLNACRMTGELFRLGLILEGEAVEEPGGDDVPAGEGNGVAAGSDKEAAD